MLESIWFFLWGLLWAMYFMLDGFDLGAGALLPFLAKNEMDKRYILNASGPFWDGNEVWLITAGGVTFAAFPPVYASMFSGLYTALMLLLFALIIRGVSFEFRSKIDGPSWRRIWDCCHFVGSAVPPVLLGVAFANFFQGVPLDQDGVIHGGILHLLNPYGLAGGVLFLLLFLVHGALWLAIRTPGELSQRAGNTAIKLWPVLIFAVVAFLVMTAMSTKLFSNYLQNPALLAILILPVGGLVQMRVCMGKNRWWSAWVSSAATIIGVTFFGVIGLFPALIPSSLNPAWSLTIHNAASSPMTLKIMLTVVCVFVPIVLGYQFWVYRLFAKKMTQNDLDYEEAY